MHRHPLRRIVGLHTFIIDTRKCYGIIAPLRNYLPCKATALRVLILERKLGVLME